jgi:hypothetical protein
MCVGRTPRFRPRHYEEIVAPAALAREIRVQYSSDRKLVWILWQRRKIHGSSTNEIPVVHIQLLCRPSYADP